MTILMFLFWVWIVGAVVMSAHLITISEYDNSAITFNSQSIPIRPVRITLCVVISLAWFTMLQHFVSSTKVK